MVLPTIGDVKELDPQIIKDHHLVALFGICQNTLGVQDHALDKYLNKVQTEQSRQSALQELYIRLSTSLVVARKNAEKQKDRNGGVPAVYRFEDGWIFVLTWVERFGIWLLKTVYPKGTWQQRVYVIKNTREAIRASAWTPTFA